MGQGLMEKELSLLSRESEGAVGKGAQARPAPAYRPQGPVPCRVHRPAISRPYGVLVVSGLPEGYQVLVNRVQYPADGEIHLPASRHLLEIQDAARRRVRRDSVTVGGGEPTVYDFASKGQSMEAAANVLRKAGHPPSERAGKP